MPLLLLLLLLLLRRFNEEFNLLVKQKHKDADRLADLAFHYVLASLCCHHCCCCAGSMKSSTC
jgi:hypothetical protein